MLIYQVANLRKIAVHDNRRTKLRFNNTDLIHPTENSSCRFNNTTLKHGITAKAIKTFIEENKVLLTTSSSGDIVFKDPSKKEEIEKEKRLDHWIKLVDELGEYDHDIVEFDDTFSKSELVFSIVVNRLV